jgi:ribosomal protein L37AE/L43A
MDCPKCKGLMQLERFSDFFLIFYAWKCINCGAVIDKTIANNRRKSLEARTVQTAATETTLVS